MTATGHLVRGLLALCLWSSWGLPAHVTADDRKPAAESFTIVRDADRLQISLHEQPIAEFVWQDPDVHRPYFRHLRTKSGLQVTRNHPPVKGTDIDDHPTMHPGLWLAFGDLNGADFWRNKQNVKLQKFVKEPQGGATATFTAEFVYLGPTEELATELCEIRISPHAAGYVLRWRSTFQPTHQKLVFGDQEEMGLGLRVATPFAVARGGRIRDAAGRINGAEVWGKSSDWCEYSGVSDRRRAGVVIMPHRDNFRPSWFHARDYGLVVANPFGRKAFTNGEASQLVVEPEQKLVLAFDVLVFSTPEDEPFDVNAVYRELSKQP